MAPARKKQKSTKPTQSIQPTQPNQPIKSIQPRLFAPFRALGFVTNDIPFNILSRSTRDANKLSAQIVTCLGNSWAMWDLSTMRLLFVSPDCENPINSIANDGTYVYVSAGPHLIKYSRGKQISKFEYPEPSELGTITLFGSQLLALRANGNGLIVFDNHSNAKSEFSHEIQFPFNFTATQILHPSTYLNKIVVASAQGDLQLWNIRTRSLIHSFQSTHLRRSLPRPSTEAITSLEQSPAIDVLAIGYSDGLISLYDIKSDEELLRMRMDGDLSINSITFRTDGEHIMATAASNGYIAFWNLNEGGRLVNVLRDAHSESTSKIEFLPNQPVLISSSGDNSVKQWLFDSPSVLPRLLKFRAGHTAPPHHIRYYGEDGKTILSAGRDNSLRYMSVVRDSRSFEMSQGSLARKAAQLALPMAALRLPPITSLAFATQRSKDWDDVLTSHADSADSYTWHVQDKKLGKHKLVMDDGVARSVTVSVCGNYGLIGTDKGKINQFNMQSGIKRRVLSIQNKYENKDALAISGVISDALNTTIVASTLDGFLYFFDFHNGALIDTLQLRGGVHQLILQRDNGIMAAICADNVVRLVDIETRRVVREFRGFTKRVSDIAFSPDSKWLVASSYDCIIRTYDIPTGTLVDAFRVTSLPTSLTFSPTGDFVATTHTDSVGIYLWANKTQLVEVPLRPISQTDVIDVGLPTMQGEVEDEELGQLESEPIVQHALGGIKDQLSDGLVTLSTMPRTRWQTLLNLDTIRERNKPAEPVKAPEQAPFFLPSLMDTQNNTSGDKMSMDVDKQDTHRLVEGALGIETQLSKMLHSAQSDKLDQLFTYLHGITPANNDADVRSLMPADLELFLKALSERLGQQKDFDTVQAQMGLALRVHADILSSDSSLRESLSNLAQAQRKECHRLFDLTNYSLGVLSFVRDIPLQ
ncbi:hypothetical protein E3P92_03138 [Wallemia ichthyophaga]|uniref:Small-subunit processome Utp21 domain-containing protein n=1 Tax=Wallemia ichthyophaga (strain EXF-994 / CBS 113033) TaxID=1299270 RepID=R9AL95_WALI9|nr:uncharacterized protein J056_003407 [Wallemia ichthyophaga EXF-994]EOR02845.1 hypothetical protein J056_003407 [Wallemia ichthyophaga EXF-994]TIB10559.1 hypothetical protein E3P92_03138 [Wallemia ichthyophaga]